MSITAIEAVSVLLRTQPEPVAGLASIGSGRSMPFSQQLLGAVDQVNKKVIHADVMVQAFALDDSIPLHQVTYALEQARLSVELMMQMRARLMEGYQDIMRMQL